jgi:hypothetical protein
VRGAKYYLKNGGSSMEVVQRNQPSQIKIEAIEYEGKPRIDVRLWVFAKQLDKMIPTRRGLSIRLDQLEAIRSDLVDAERALKDAA